MTDTCIVCLGDLRVSDPKEPLETYTEPEANPEGHVHIKNESVGGGETEHSHEAQGRRTWRNDDFDADDGVEQSPPLPATTSTKIKSDTSTTTATTNQSKQAEDDEIIAHLLPCGHNLHDSCLKPWVERANSCPICRAQFNMVELRNFLDSPSFSSYPVQDKQQQAELDPTLVIDQDLLDIEEPCIVCGSIGTGNEVMFCDGCDRTVHVFCAGYTDSPEVWYCETCVSDLDNTSRRTRAQPQGSRRGRRSRGRGRVSEWDRVWQQVWARLDLDLDFPFDDEPTEPRRTLTQRLELEAWQERLRVANRQGGTNRFRDTASTLLDRNRQQPPAPESQEEIRAWNAFDKVRSFANDERPASRRKRKSATTSPSSPRDNNGTDGEAAPERKLKRPRTRRNIPIGPEPGPSTTRPVQPLVDLDQPPPEQPSFLKALLHEVEKQPAPSDRSSPDGAEHSGDEQHSSYFLSPAASPLHSGQVSPSGALSVTPPPQDRPRPASPTPLTSIVRPRFSSPSPPFSPYSPAASPVDRSRRRVHPRTQPSSPPGSTSPSSPSRNMSYSTKTEIQRMVKATLAPRYRGQQITKDQYTDINRDVSRMMYEKVGDAEGLADQHERDKWQQFAADQVEKAIDLIRVEEQHGDAPVS